jgi:hypothetical protein
MKAYETNRTLVTYNPSFFYYSLPQGVTNLARSSAT